MGTALDVANWFLAATAKSAGDSITNLKLQKLVYYAQAYSLAFRGQPLFNESIEAWDHGPVAAPVYHRYKYCGRDPIPCDGVVIGTEFDADEIEILDLVLQTQGHKSAWELRQQTHREKPWLAHSQDNNSADGGEITHEQMASYFSQLKIPDVVMSEFLEQANRAINGTHIAIPNEIDTADDFVAWARTLKSN